MKANLVILLSLLFLALGGLTPEHGVGVRPNGGSETEQETPAGNEPEVASRPKPTGVFRRSQGRGEFSLTVGADRGSGSSRFRFAGNRYLSFPAPVSERDLYTLQRVYRL